MFRPLCAALSLAALLAGCDDDGIRDVGRREFVTRKYLADAFAGWHQRSEARSVEGVLEDSDTTSVCPWKGAGHYYDVVVDGEVNADAAWYYPAPSQAAAEIKDHVAFWKGVRVEH